MYYVNVISSIPLKNEENLIKSDQSIKEKKNQELVERRLAGGGGGLRNNQRMNQKKQTNNAKNRQNQKANENLKKINKQQSQKEKKQAPKNKDQAPGVFSQPIHYFLSRNQSHPHHHHIKRLDCKLVWRLFDYYYQDFMCLEFDDWILPTHSSTTNYQEKTKKPTNICSSSPKCMNE